MSAPITDDFDPYYTWLGIRPEEQPPDHYRLIGLRQLEDNADVISNAADRQMQFLRSMQVGKRSAQSQKLLNEISAAGGCLLDPQRKAKYDQELRAKESAKAQAAQAAVAKARPIPKTVPLPPMPRPVPLVAPQPQADLFSPPTPQNNYASPVNVAIRSPTQPASRSVNLPLILGGAAGGIVLLLVVVIVAGQMFSGGNTAAAKVGKVPKEEAPVAVPPIQKSTGNEAVAKPAPQAKEPTKEIAQPTSTPAVGTSNQNVWQYGIGGFDEQTQRTGEFSQLGHWTGDAWQVSSVRPDEKRGWIYVDALGGSAGYKTSDAAIRRWTAPQAGKLSIGGELTHFHQVNKGDGVRGRIVSSRSGPLGEVKSLFSSDKVSVTRVEVQAGDHIDFIVDCLSDWYYDTFRWPVELHLTDAQGKELGTWNSEADFHGPLSGQTVATTGGAESIKPPVGLATGRFVRVELPGKDRVLNLAEVQIFSGGDNAAVKGKATQSSTDYEGPANLANDGNTDGNYPETKSVSHTRLEDNPWWEIDLGTEMPLEKIALWNRTDGGTDTRLQGYKVLALDGARKVVWEISPSDIPKPSSEFVLSGVKQPSVPVVRSGPALPTPVHSWSFDEKSGDTVADSGKGDANGKNPVHLAGWSADQPRFVPGKMGNALRFSQQEQFAAAERYVDYPQFTLAFWLKVLGEDGINPRIAHPWVELNYEHRTGVGVLGLVVEPNKPEIGKWYHYAVAVDQTKRQVTIFRDGAEVASGMLGDYESRSNVKYWAFGHNQDKSNPNDSIHGELDEIKLYDRILTSTEVKQFSAAELAQAFEPASSAPSANPTFPAAAAKNAIPDAAAREAALTKVSSIFTEELKAAKTAPLKQNLAKKLLDVAATTTDLPERFVLLTEARRLAVEAKEVALAMLALETLGNDFAIDFLAEKVKLLQGLNLGTTTATQRSAILTAVCEAGREALDAESVDSINGLVVLARSLAAKNATAEGKAAVKEFTESAGQWQKRMESLRKAEQTLAATPDNPAANLLVGLHTFFVRGKQQEGLAMLAKGSDPHLASAAKARTDNITMSVASSFAEADAWHDAIATAIPDYKGQIQRQALASYTLLASTTAGLDNAKAVTRRDQLSKDVAASPDPFAKRLRMQDLPESTPGLVGRVFVEGKDAGFLLAHRPPGEMKPKAIEQILALTKASSFRMVLVGTIRCPTPCICHVFQTGKSRGPAQVVMIDGKPVSAVGGMNRRDSDERFPLAAGDHIVQWTVDCDGTNAPRIDLYLNRGGLPKPIEPQVTRAQAFEARKLPVSKEIDVSAYGPDPQ